MGRIKKTWPHSPAPNLQSKAVNIDTVSLTRIMNITSEDDCYARLMTSHSQEIVFLFKSLFTLIGQYHSTKCGSVVSLMYILTAHTWDSKISPSPSPMKSGRKRTAKPLNITSGTEGIPSFSHKLRNKGKHLVPPIWTSHRERERLYKLIILFA